MPVFAGSSRRRSRKTHSSDRAIQPTVVEFLEHRTYLTTSTGAEFVNVAVADDPAIQNQPTLAVNPLDSQHVIVVYKDESQPVATGQAGVGVSVSFDAGTTWSRGSIDLPEGFDDASTAPVVEFAADGRVFVAFQATGLNGFDLDIVPSRGGNTYSITTDHFETNNGIFVASSMDGGLSWSSAASVSRHVFEGTPVQFDVQPELAIDTFETRSDGSPNPFFGNIYAAWVTYYPTGQFPFRPDFLGGGVAEIAVSRDGGTTWERLTRTTFFPVDLNMNGSFEPSEFFPIEVPALLEDLGLFADAGPASSFGAIPRITIGPDGDLYVANFGGGTFSVFHSPDGGATMLQPARDTATRTVFGNSFFARSGFPLFETQPDPGLVRSIVADPTQPGRLYAVESLFIADAASNGLDLADIFVATSADHGATWEFTFTGNGTTLGQSIPVNDDNGGLSVTREQEDPVVTVQGLPELSIDESGNVAVIWFDTRRGLNDSFLDIFGAKSLNAGVDFTPNFRITTESSPLLPEALPGDADFLPAAEIGNRLGFTTADGFGYAAWTDFRNGSPDIFFSRFALEPVPPGLNDRFEQNDTPETATDLGTIVQETITRLTLVPQESDWFAVQAGAIGDLRVEVSTSDGSTFAPEAADQFGLELWDESGTARLVEGIPTLNDAGRVVGWRLSQQSTAGARFLVRVVGSNDESSPSLEYRLFAEALTADFGQRAEVSAMEALLPGELATFRIVSPAAGSLRAQLAASEDSQLELSVVDATTLAPLGDSVTTDSGEGFAETSTRTFELSELLVMVENRGETASDFLLDLVNLDESATPGGRILSIPVGGSVPNVGDFNNDGIPDLLPSPLVTNIVGLLPGNGDGTFQTPRFFQTGANLGSFGSAKDAEVADLNLDGNLDIIAANTSSADLSVLLGRGDGTFDSQRRFDTLAVASEVEIADVNGDGFPDALTVDVQRDIVGQISVLLGRGDGTFQPQFVLPTEVLGGSKQIFFADFDNDGTGDLILQPDTVSLFELQKGNGDGTFGESIQVTIPGIGNMGRPVDLNGDGNLDVLIGEFTSDVVIVLFGNGDFTFQPAQLFPAGGQAIQPQGVDIGSPDVDEDGNPVLGLPDGIIDIVAPLGSDGETGISVLPGIADEFGDFVTFGAPISVPGPANATQLSIADLDNDGVQDIVVGDFDGLTLVFGAEPEREQNTTQETARNLGVVAHHVEPTRTITSITTDAWFRLKVPIEAVAVAGDEIIDIGAFFDAEGGDGLQMEVLDAAGNLLSTDDRVRLRVPQGDELFVHIFARDAGNGTPGTGAYSLNINVLPQLVSVSAEPLLPGMTDQPGGPTGLLVLTFQGDRLDQELAEDPSNYTVTFLGQDGLPDTADDRIIPLGADDPTRQPVVANPSSNVDVSSGQTFATAVRQTVTLAFDEALPVGSYRIDVSPAITTRDFNATETARLAADTRFAGHTVVSVDGEQIVEGISVEIANLVQPAGLLGDFSEFEDGTSFLTQLQNDLSFLLDSLLTEFGDSPEITPTILNQIRNRFRVAIGDLGDRVTSMLIVFLDPVSLDLVDPGNRRVTYSLQSNQVQRTLPNAFVEVGGNVEVVVVPNVNGRFQLNVADVPPTARGGVVFLGQQSDMVQTITDDLRGGMRNFSLDLREAQAVPTQTQQPTTTDESLTALALASNAEQLRGSQSANRLAAGATDSNTVSTIAEVLASRPEAEPPPQGEESPEPDFGDDSIWQQFLRLLSPLGNTNDKSDGPDSDNTEAEPNNEELPPEEWLRRLIQRALEAPTESAPEGEPPPPEVPRNSEAEGQASLPADSSITRDRFTDVWKPTGFVNGRQPAIAATEVSASNAKTKATSAAVTGLALTWFMGQSKGGSDTNSTGRRVMRSDRKRN